MLPDLTDDVKMAHIGKMTVLRKARREVAKKLRDRLIPMLNSVEMEGDSWNVSGVVELVEEIHALNQAIADIN